MKKYMDIERLKEGYNDKNWLPNDIVVVQEKMDGSNASFQYDDVSREIKVFSRRQELTPTNTLNGFYNWVKIKETDDKNFANIIKSHANLVFFGEWGVKNKVQYKDEYYHNFYFYDIYDVANEKYLTREEVKEFANILNLGYVNTLYVGEFKNWDNMRQFMGKSNLALVEGEGVVVKNQTLLNAPRGEYYLKLVCDSFSEVMKVKIKAPKAANPNEATAKAIVESIVTERRVEKMLNNLRDDGILVEPIDEKQLGVVSKHLPKRIWEDINKEEPESVKEGLGLMATFGKMCAAAAMNHARAIIIHN